MKKLILPLLLLTSRCLASTIINPASSGGTVNSGTAGQNAYYATAGTAISGSSTLMVWTTSVTAPSAGGLGVTYGLTVGSATVQAATAGQVLVADANQQIATVGVSSTSLTYLTNLFHYKRPNLVYISSFTVSVETGTYDGAVAAEVLFPDGNVRSETANSFYLLNVSRVAGWTGGTLQSGLQTGTASNNSWLAVYAVGVSTNSTDWVMVGSTVAPIPSNYAVLNATFTTNNWVFMNYVRLGNGNAGNTAIVKFTQSGNMTTLLNAVTDGYALPQPGVELANTNSASSLVYTYVAGMTGSNVPPSIGQAIWNAGWATASSAALVKWMDAAGTYHNVDVHFDTATSGAQTVMRAASDGLQISSTATGAGTITLSGWVDNALGVGSNPRF